MTDTRITAGKWRGRKIDTPSGHTTRPTSSKVREALFNILGARIDEAVLLDLYAGAGTFSFEALSRGAAHATLVERDRKASGLLAKTAARLDCADDVAIATASVEQWLARNAGSEFDIVWLDPPYAETNIEAVLVQAATLTRHLLVCEHRKSRPVPEKLGTFTKVRSANYGQTTLSFYEPVEE